jgi:hypothetical protein
LWDGTEVRNVSDNSGIGLLRGLDQIDNAAGQWGQTKTDPANSIHADGAYSPVSRAQLAAIRSVPWPRLSTDALHLTGLQLRVGRELLVAATRDESLRSAITDRLMGLTGNFRRLAIIHALAENDATAAIEMLSSSDLYFLVETMRNEIAGLKLQGPLFEEFASQKNNAAWREIALLGGYHLRTYGNVHSALVSLGPYEEYERLLMKDAMSERLSHVLLDAAEMADRAGIPIDALAVLSEPLLRQLAGDMHMADNDDWLAAIHAMSHISFSKLELSKVFVK